VFANINSRLKMFQTNTYSINIVVGVKYTKIYLHNTSSIAVLTPLPLLPTNSKERIAI